MTTSIRKAKAADLGRLNTISLAAKAHWGYPKEWLEHWKDGLTLNENDLEEMQVFVLDHKDEVIGFCAMKDETEYYEVEHLWVVPTYIGKGFGKQLLQGTLDLVIKEDKPTVVLSDPNAEAFYARQGFVTFDQKESFPKGRFLPFMRKEFDANHPQGK